MYIMCVILCLFGAVSQGVGALQISIIIIIVTDIIIISTFTQFRGWRSWGAGVGRGACSNFML